MKRLRRISLDSFDELSHGEASKLIGGVGNDSIPPPRTTMPTPRPTIYGSILPGGGYSGGYNGNGYGIGSTIKPGGGSVVGNIKF